MSATSVYLDYNASAPAPPEVISAMAESLKQVGNPSSVHRQGRLVRSTIEEARSKVAALVNGNPKNVIFTSGGTEANNLAMTLGANQPILVSKIEHDSVLASAKAMASEVTYLDVTSSGVIDMVAADNVFAQLPCPKFISVMLANNETGVIQPVAEIVKLANKIGAVIHCDAVQAAGKIIVDIEKLDVDLLSLSAHKIGGPQGVGALIFRNGLEIPPLLHGGAQEFHRRAGTENVAGIVGFGVAAELAQVDATNTGWLAGLRNEIERKLIGLAPDIKIFGADVLRLPNTLCFADAGMSSEVQIMTLDLEGVSVSAGAACSSGKVSESTVLIAMGASDKQLKNSIRISLGRQSSAQDINRFIEVWAELYHRMTKTSSSHRRGCQ